MASGVGHTLSQARRRREIDLSAVETATRIRRRFLHAIEKEEWEALPGGVYTRGFIRAYGAYLGLDGDRLAEDYRREVEGAGTSREAQGEPVATATVRPRGRRPIPHAGLIAAGAVTLAGALAIVVLPGSGHRDGDGGSAGPGAGPHRAAVPAAEARKHAETARPSGSGVSMSLAAKAEVWVCVLDARGRHLVDGQILEAGAGEGPFHSGSFTVSFGNGEVSMLIDGKEAEIPATPSPIGYSIDPSGSLTPLGEAERPTCA